MAMMRKRSIDADQHLYSTLGRMLVCGSPALLASESGWASCPSQRFANPWAAIISGPRISSVRRFRRWQDVEVYDDYGGGREGGREREREWHASCIRFFHLPPIVIHGTIPTGGLSSEERRTQRKERQQGDPTTRRRWDDMMRSCL